MNFKLEEKLRKLGYQVIIGVDEAGRGPLAGPVVAAAVAVRNFQFSIFNFQSNPKSQKPNGQRNTKYQILNTRYWNLIRDSKKLSAKQRERAFDFIQKNFYVGVGVCDHKIIDRINILQASLLAMKKAVTSLMRGISKSQIPISNKIPNSKNKNTKYHIPYTKYIILVDGNKIIPNLNHEQKAIVSGDKSVKSISAASIIAKVTRDRLMLKMHRKYPVYNFARHKGYGTRLHLEQLEKFGPSPIHRLSFRPVRECSFLPKTAFDVKFRKEK